MGRSPSSILAALGLALPPRHQPVANYLGAVPVGRDIWVSGQGPVWGQEVRYRGCVGAALSLQEGQKAAALTALNLLAQAADVAGGLDRIGGCSKLFGLVLSAPDFTDQHLVLNGASDLIEALFPESRGHARAAVASSSLPLSISVELDAVFYLA